MEVWYVDKISPLLCSSKFDELFKMLDEIKNNKFM